MHAQAHMPAQAYERAQARTHERAHECMLAHMLTRAHNCQCTRTRARNWQCTCTRREILALPSADVYSLLERAGWVHPTEAPLPPRLYARLFDRLYDGCVVKALPRTSRTAAIQSTVERCYRLLASRANMLDFARAVDCFTLVRTVTNETELHSSCDVNGILTAGHCFCNTWRFGKQCENEVRVPSRCVCTRMRGLTLLCAGRQACVRYRLPVLRSSGHAQPADARRVCAVPPPLMIAIRADGTET
jgi:hypothetical protein